ARARRRIRDRARRAHRRASAATDAQIRIDLDLLARAIAGDRLGRADVDARRATRLLVAAVRAQPGLVVEELRLLEFADQAAQLDQHFDADTAGRMEIALRRRVLRKRRLRAQVEHEIEGLARRLRFAPEVDR